MDILYLVDRLENLIASSRRMPLVNQIIIKESDILNIIDQMRTSIPDEIKQARRIIQEKERIFAQAQAEASSIVIRAREEAERTLNREGLTKLADERSRDILYQAQEQAEKLRYQTEEQVDQMKADADSYATETLRNLREHLVTVEEEISRTVLSIEKGLESLEGSLVEQAEEEYAEDQTPHTPDMPPLPRRASLAADTMGGPNF
jgi:cell division septum initiation protein DivIVA